MQEWWSATGEPAVRDGKIRPHKVKIMPGGLAGVKDGWKFMDEGKVSGVKLVYFIGESFLSLFFSCGRVDIFGWQRIRLGWPRRNEGTGIGKQLVENWEVRSGKWGFSAGYFCL